MFTLRNPLAKAFFYAKIKAHSCADSISRWVDAATFREIQESADGGSTRLFCFLNLIFLVSLILLSPDKLTQVLSSVRPSWMVFDWIQEFVETLGKLAPF